MPTSRNYPPLLIWFVTAVMAAAVPVAAAALLEVAGHPPDAAVAAGVAVFALAAITAEFQPVPLDGSGARAVSLSFIFLLATQILFGWQYGVLVALLSTVVVGAFEQSPLIRRAFNTAVYTLAVFASALPGLLLGLNGATADPAASDRLTQLAILGGTLTWP